MWPSSIYSPFFKKYVPSRQLLTTYVPIH
uniref:Uncharacterized protein n=1 Tax=Rhizophora mucronata TaxID=61149 RepID=A0A2P2NVW0_RHIMU